MLKTTKLFKKLALKAFNADNNEAVGNSSSKTNKTVVNLSKNEKFENLTHMPNIGAIRKLNFLTSNAKKIFNYLWLTFIKF